MWNKDDAQPNDGSLPAARTPSRRPSGGGPAVIGPSISIEGELRGDEDLVVEGRVQGLIHLPHHAVTIGGAGQVKGEVRAQVVTVEGRVEGEVHGESLVVIRSSGQMAGAIHSPRLQLDEGCRFDGDVVMKSDAVKAR